MIRQKISVEDLVPPFRKGDWIYACSAIVVQIIGRNVQRAKSTPVFVGPMGSSSGWILGDLDCEHFRVATRNDVEKSIARLEKKRAKVERTLSDLDQLLEEMDRREER